MKDLSCGQNKPVGNGVLDIPQTHKPCKGNQIDTTKKATIVIVAFDFMLYCKP